MWLAFLVGVLGVGLFFARYERKANEFDLSKLDSVESASIIYDRTGKSSVRFLFRTGNRFRSVRFRRI